jgi:streptomycin 3"-adenylyltransferase
MKYKFPSSAPKFAREALEQVLLHIHSILRENLAGVYLYGSLAMDCFNPRSSDIDVILVVKKGLSDGQKNRIIEYLKTSCSKKRRIEMSIIDSDVLKNPRYPARVDLHFEYWGNIFEDEEDNEILSNLYTTRERGFCVWGASVATVFSKIPPEYHLRSVIEDIEHTKRYLNEKPERLGYNVQVYWVLSSCRILAFIREEKVLSKLEGGQWGLANLPEEYCNMVEQALSCYQGKRNECIWNQDELDAFVVYMTDAILNEAKSRKGK